MKIGYLLNFYGSLSRIRCCISVTNLLFNPSSISGFSMKFANTLKNGYTSLNLSIAF